jgi:DNA-binding CsgD family transcriptional regulator
MRPGPGTREQPEPQRRGRSFDAALFSEVDRNGPPPKPFEPGRHTPSGRDLDVLALAASGLRNREIGDRLGISEETVKSHIHGVLVKLPARNRTHAVAIAIRRGLILPRTETIGNRQGRPRL